MTCRLLLLVLPLHLHAGRLSSEIAEGWGGGAPAHNYCGDSVPFAENRKGHNRAENRGHDCKCPQNKQLTGASRACISSTSEKFRKFSGTELKGQGCYCRTVSNTLEYEDTALLGMLTSPSMEVQEYGLVRIGSKLISTDSARTRARKMGFIGPITDFLGPKGNEELKVKAVAALQNVVQGNTQSVNEACRLKAATYLGQLLEKKKRNDLDVSTAVKVLNLMQLFVEATPEGKQAVLAADTMDVIFHMLDVEEKVAKEAIGVLQAIATTPEVGQSNTFVMERLAETLQNERASQTGKNYAVKLLDSLALENADALSKIRTDGKVIEALVNTFTMKVKGLGTDESFIAMKALSKMAGGELSPPHEFQDNRKATILKSEGVLLRLLSIISSPDSEFAMEEQAKKLLKLLTSFEASDVIDELMRILKHNRVEGRQLILEVSAMGFENIKRGLKVRLTNSLRYDELQGDTADMVEKLLQEI